jgi:hypothetical protein
MHRLNVTALATLAASLLLSNAAVGQQGPPPSGRLDVPVESPGVPAYVRLENLGVGWLAPRNDKWTALVFYRDPECIPPNFDLGQFFDFPGPGGPGAYGCPSLTEGFYLYLGRTPDPTTPPNYSLLRNVTPALPIWFVGSAELDRLLARGGFTIGELAALPSLVRGRGWHFEEKLYPGGVNPEPGITMSARGRLETGGQFSFFWHDHPARGEQVFELSLDLGPDRAGPPAYGRDGKCRIHPDLPACRP